MPKIISYTPGWLSRPSPGFQLFNTAQSTSSTQQGWRGSSQERNGNLDSNSHTGPNRTIAQRGTEIFLAAGKQIRWTDLVSLKDEYEEQLRTPSRRPKPAPGGNQPGQEDEGPEDLSYRVLKVPIGEQIRQLSVSPNGNLLAIATSHTVHIAILPDSSHLGQIPNKPIKLKTYTVGPTTHVLSQSQVTNILWHPCGAGGNCLVTVTADAIIRLWEFNIEDRFSSANPALAIDLRKLVVGSSEEESFGPEDFRKSRGFSSDDVGLEVASACFGGSGSSHESGWSAMTLWIAMKGGDVYALCPLLPSKWQPSATLIPSLSSAAVAKNALIEEQGESPDLENKRQCRDQLGWIRDVDGQDPTFLYPDDEFSPEIYNRPSHPGPIPRLQGPFQIFPDDIDEYLELSDIHVVASKIDSAEFMNDDDSDSEAESVDDSGVSASVIVLMTRNGRVYVCLDLEGIEGQWLPRKKPKHSFSPPPEPYLVVLEGLDTLSRTEQLDLQWPTFSPDINSRYSLFATHNHGVFYFSFDPWIQSLEKELQSNEKFGAPLRIDLIRNGPGTLTERILHFDEEESSDSERAVSACLTFDDSDLGYFLLTSINRHPEAVTFDDQYQSYGRPQLKYEAEEDQMPDMSLLNIGPVRTIYQPSDSFYAESSLPRFLEKNVPSRHKRMIKEEIRLSTATLDLMTQAHRILSEETHRLGLAASDLFRRCERLRDELSDQVSRANEVAQRTENLSGEDADIYLETIKRKQPPSLEQRLENVRSKQEELTGRYDRLRKKFSNAGGRALSEKERLWVEEVDQAHTSTASPPPEAEDDEQLASELWHRCREAEELKQELIDHSKDISPDDQPVTNGMDEHKIPDDVRKLKLAQVMRLLDTQSNLVEEAQIRLRRLVDPALS